MYAVLETGSKQYRVSSGDTLEIERLAVEAGQPVTFDRVLLVNNEGRIDRADVGEHLLRHDHSGPACSRC